MHAFLTEAAARGFIHQCTDEHALSAALDAGTLSAYVGYDCTADSLHVGNLVSIMMLRLWQKHGQRPVVLMGGGTTRIGDPSGKDETRQMLTDETIAANMAGCRRAFAHYLDFNDGPDGAIMVNNADWLDRLGYIELLREVGPHFTINRMLTMDSVRLRLDREQPLTFLEFNYMISQSYDFRELFRRQNVRLQMGGSDQWGNIVSGIDLIRRTDGAQSFGLTTALITTASGAKMGKTARGAVWLNAERLPPNEYWQFWRNSEDADVGRFLRLFTELPLDEIIRLEKLDGADINEAKKTLAHEATRLLHGDEAAEQAAATASVVFGALHAAAESDTIVASGFAGLQTLEVTKDDAVSGIPLIRLLTQSGLTGSNGEARRLIRGGGARLNGETISDEARQITQSDLPAKLSAGRKQHRLIKLKG